MFLPQYIWFAAYFMNLLGKSNADLSTVKLIILSCTSVGKMPRNIKPFGVMVLSSKYTEGSCFGSLSARPFPTFLKWLFN